jgi:hypothetical protein
MTIDTLTTFLGWCSVINIGVLLFSTLMMIVVRDFAIKLHSSLFGVNPEELPIIYLQYLGNYKIAIIILNIVPYIALKVMA